MKGILVGYKKFESKKGNKCNVAIVVNEFTSFEKSKGNFGSKAQEIFVPEEFALCLKQENLNKEVTVDYEVNDGSAFLVNFKI